MLSEFSDFSESWNMKFFTLDFLSSLNPGILFLDSYVAMFHFRREVIHDSAWNWGDWKMDRMTTRMKNAHEYAWRRFEHAIPAFPWPNTVRLLIMVIIEICCGQDTWTVRRGISRNIISNDESNKMLGSNKQDKAEFI